MPILPRIRQTRIGRADDFEEEERRIFHRRIETRRNRLRPLRIGDGGQVIMQELQIERLQRRIGQESGLHPHHRAGRQPQMAMQQLRRGNRIDFQFEGSCEIGLQR